MPAGLWCWHWQPIAQPVPDIIHCSSPRLSGHFWNVFPPVRVQPGLLCIYHLTLLGEEKIYKINFFSDAGKPNQYHLHFLWPCYILTKSVRKRKPSVDGEMSLVEGCRETKVFLRSRAPGILHRSCAPKGCPMRVERVKWYSNKIIPILKHKLLL